MAQIYYVLFIQLKQFYICKNFIIDPWGVRLIC
jgi:hypothetical protein